MGELVRWLYCWADEWGNKPCILLPFSLHLSVSPKLNKPSVSASQLWYKQKQLSRYKRQQRENIINTSSALERAPFRSQVGREGHIVTKPALNLPCDCVFNSLFLRRLQMMLVLDCAMPVEYETLLWNDHSSGDCGLLSQMLRRRTRIAGELACRVSRDKNKIV